MQPHIVLCELADATSTLGLESQSPFCVKAHRALKAAGLAYERRHGARPDAFRAHSPLGQVPVLLVDGEAVYDSTRIVERVEQIAGPIGGPRDARARAEAWLWEELADTGVNGFLVAARWADERNWDKVKAAYFGRAPWLVRTLIVPRIRARLLRSLVARDVWRAGSDACWDRFHALLDRLEARAPREGFWVDDRLSVADVALFAQLQSFRTPLTAWQARAVETRRALASWLDRVDAATRAQPSVSGSFAAAA